LATPVRKRLSSSARRERILEGALGAFAERGYSETSMSAIAERAGITPAVIYDHFTSKAELHATLLETEAKALLESVAARVAAAEPSAEARFRAGVDGFFAFVEQNNFAWWLLFRDPPADATVSSAYERVQASASAGVAALLRANATPAVLSRPDAERDLEMLAQLLRTGQNGLAAWWYEHPETSRAVLVDRVVELYWTGLQRLSEAP
jgi:AcrR family transcriptional regulator